MIKCYRIHFYNIFTKPFYVTHYLREELSSRIGKGKISIGLAALMISILLGSALLVPIAAYATNNDIDKDRKGLDNKIGTDCNSAKYDKDCDFLSPPEHLTATPFPYTTLFLSWTASAGATWYQVFSSTSSSGPFTLVGGTSGT